MTRRTKLPKKCEKTQNVTLKDVYCFFKQLTIASAAASLYAMTFVTFVGLCAPLALCCDPIYWGEIPFRIKSVNAPHESYIPITYAAKTSRVADLTYSFSKSVVITSAIPIITVVPLFH